jgi:hypothetical protein
MDKNGNEGEETHRERKEERKREKKTDLKRRDQREQKLDSKKPVAHDSRLLFCRRATNTICSYGRMCRTKL